MPIDGRLLNQSRLTFGTMIGLNLEVKLDYVLKTDIQELESQVLKVISALFLLIQMYSIAVNAIETRGSCPQLLGTPIPREEVLLDREIMKQRILSSGRPGLILIGFESDSLGKVQPIWAQSEKFTSTRHVSSGLFGSGWNELREATMVSIEFKPHSGVTLHEDIQQVFPSHIRRQLELGNIPETVSQRSIPTFELLQEVFNSKKEHWSVLMMAASPNVAEGMMVMEGRTGIPLLNGIPEVRVFANGREQVLEAKGIGLPEGGFKSPIRKNHDVISGGISKYFAMVEFQVASDMKGVTEVSVPLVASFLSESWGHQSLAFRWTPGTRRSSFSTENKSLYISRNAKNLSRILGSTIARVLARGYLPQLHMENFVVSDRDSHVDLTDFSDLEPLSGFLKSNSGIEDMLRKLELLLNGNYINLSYEFDPIEFWRGLADECDKMGLLGVGFDLDVKPKLKARSSDLFYRSESYVRLTEDKNIQYVLRRLLTLGIVVSIGGQNVPIQHGLNVEGTISKLDLALAIGKEGYASRRERVMEIVREGMFEQLDRDVVHEFEVFRVRNRLDWSVEGARKFFAQERFRESYRDYLRSFTEFYRAGRFEHRFFIEGEIDKIVEMKMIIYAQVELVIKLDILQHSYRHVGDTAKADHYLKHLEEILAQDPFEFLKAYEKR